MNDMNDDHEQIPRPASHSFHTLMSRTYPPSYLACRSSETHVGSGSYRRRGRRRSPLDVRLLADAPQGRLRSSISSSEASTAICSVDGL